jgi:hypothetical protein
MYDFSHFLHKPETHDVDFIAVSGARASFCKMLLVSLSEVWRSREGEQQQHQPTSHPWGW